MIDTKNYKAGMCPVCNKFYFSELDEDDIEIYDKMQCRMCGWYADMHQQENTDERNGNNEMSLNEYKEHYKNLLEEDENYTYYEANYIPTPHICPVCNKHTFKDLSSHDVCPFCGWEDDGVMENNPEEYAGCSNDLCLKDFIQRYNDKVKEDPNYKYKTYGL